MLVVRVRPDNHISDRLRTTIASIDPTLPVSTQRLSDSLAFGLLPQRVVAMLAGGLGVLGLLLVGIGVYGVTAYLVTRRTREIGLRVALGASRSTVIRMVVAQALWPVVAGLVPGLLLAAMAAQVLRAYLLGSRRSIPSSSCLQ